MKSVRNIGIILIFLLLLIPIVQADALTPPIGIRIAGYVSSHDQIGIWWMNPIGNSDFDGTQIWFDDAFIGTVPNTTHFYYAEFLSTGNHSFGARTIDFYGNVNMTFVNITVPNNGYFSCEEAWFCPDYCGVLSIGTKTPIDPWNISQGQNPTQSVARQYTDIKIWILMIIITIISLLLSRSPNVSTIRPILFAVVGFITSITATWMSLSIAWLGDFIPGATVVYTNQTNVAIFHYQVVEVVATPWITALCISLLAIMVINGIDIIMRYIQKNEDMQKLEQKKDWKV